MSPKIREIYSSVKKQSGVTNHLRKNEELYEELINEIKKENRQKKVSKFIASID